MPPVRLSKVALPEPPRPMSTANGLCSMTRSTPRRTACSRCGSIGHGPESGTGLGSMGAMSPMSGSSWRVSAIFV